MFSGKEKRSRTWRRLLPAVLACTVVLGGCITVTEPEVARTDAQSSSAAIEIAFFDISMPEARKVDVDRLARLFAAQAPLRTAFSCNQEAGEMRCVSLDRGKSGGCEPLYEAIYLPAGTLTLRKTYVPISVLSENATQCFVGRATFAALRDLIQGALVKEFGAGQVRIQDLSRGEVQQHRNGGKIRF
jgi:hypothetical protein